MAIGKLVKVEFVTRWSPGLDDGVKVTGGDGEMTTIDAARPNRVPRQWEFNDSTKEVMELQGMKVVFYPEAITLAEIDIGYVLPGNKIQWTVGATIERAITAYRHLQNKGAK